jgi:hypothetical protein
MKKRVPRKFKEVFGMYKTYYNVSSIFDIWKVIDDMEALNLRVIGVTNRCITVARHKELTFEEIDVFMANRGFY